MIEILDETFSDCLQSDQDRFQHTAVAAQNPRVYFSSKDFFLVFSMR